MKLLEFDTGIQIATLVHDRKRGLGLLLDDMPQFVEASEHRYHECLAVVPTLLCQPKTVFIGGGGDGLAAARLLRFDCVERIVLCDYDPGITELARTHKDMVRLNRNSMNDPRVEVTHADAVSFLEKSEDTFDLVILDFPDPYFAVLGRLYSVDFYQTVKRHLAPGGVVVTQTIITPEATRIVRASMRHVFEHEAYYRLYRQVGFTLGSDQPIEPVLPVPDWARFLSPCMLEKLTCLPRDLALVVDPEAPLRGTPINDGDGTSLVQAVLLKEKLPAMASRHPYRPNTYDLYLTHETVEELTEDQIRLIMATLRHKSDVVLVASETLAQQHHEALLELGYTQDPKSYQHYYSELPEDLMARHRILWQQLDDGTVTALESLCCRPSENPEIAELFDNYLREFGHRFFDMPESASDLSAWGRFVLTRNDAGEIISFSKLLDKPNDRIEIELFHGLGKPRQNLQSILLLLSYLSDSGVTSAETFTPVGVFGAGLRRLGVDLVDTLRIYISRVGEQSDATT